MIFPWIAWYAAIIPNVVLIVKRAQLTYYIFECLPEFLNDLLNINIGNKIINCVQKIDPHIYKITKNCALEWSAI